MLYDPEKEYVEYIAGDPKGPRPDVKGNPFDKRGQTQTWDLKKGVVAEPKIRYKDMIIECELYELEGNLSLHMICPKCHNMLWVREPNKKVAYDPSTGLIDVEASKCTWEVDPNSPMRLFGVSLCNFSFGVVKSRMLEHR
jgi:hypothetical protein